MAQWCRKDELIVESGFESRYLSSLNILFARDYNGKCPFINDCASLDLDAIETDNSGDNDCTMDGVIGISKYDGQSYTNSRLLLIELRNDYKSVSGLIRNKMAKKIKHSKEILAPRPIHSESVFVFDDAVIGEVRWWIKNFSNQYAEMRLWKPMTVSDFEDYVGIESDFPYIPVTDLSHVEEELMASASDDEKLYSNYEKWRSKVSYYFLRYNNLEARAICEAMLHALSEIKECCTCNSSELVQVLLDELETDYSINSESITKISDTI